ncbi:MAG: response regulator [Candidatus Coatesbacteria bacterium]|nr:MAG: response regulator [Candidatus Coatesbacteria bacterium]
MADRKKLLLVDDTDTILLFLKTLLAGQGFDFLTAKNGEEAVAKARQERPDLILLDVFMPVMDGIEACRVIKGDPTLKDIPVVVVTARSEAENVEQCFEAGCDDYVFKPIRKLELLDKINRLLGEG